MSKHIENNLEKDTIPDFDCIGTNILGVNSIIYTLNYLGFNSNRTDHVLFVYVFLSPVGNTCTAFCR